MTLRDTMLDIGTDHEDCTLHVLRVDEDEATPGVWVLVCTTHEETGPLLDFAELEAQHKAHERHLAEREARRKAREERRA